MKLITPLLVTALFLSACDPDAPETIQTLDGEEASLSSLINGRPVVINFWASTCSFCKDELPHFEELANRHPELAVIGINLQEDLGTAKQYWESGGYTFPSLLDPHSEITTQFNVFTRPTTVVIDAEGNEVFRKNGPMNAQGIRELGKLGNREEEIKEIKEIKDSQIEVSNATSVLAGFYKGDVQHLIPLREILSGGPPKDGIPSIDNPTFLDASDVTYLEDDDLGIFVHIGDEYRFYPYVILNWHEIVNDTIGGTPVAVTYCPLCATGVVYDRRLSDTETEFGVSGLLYQSNLLMYDRNSESLWNQVTGQAVVGPRTEQQLRFIESNIARFGSIKHISDNLLVLSTDTGFARNYGVTPYAGYEQDRRTIFPTSASGDERLHPKELVYGIAFEKSSVAITDALIRKRGSLTLDAYGIEIVYDEDRDSIKAEDTSSREAVILIPAFWFSWLSQYPDTELIK